MYVYGKSDSSAKVGIQYMWLYNMHAPFFTQYGHNINMFTSQLLFRVEPYCNKQAIDIWNVLNKLITYTLLLSNIDPKWKRISAHIELVNKCCSVVSKRSKTPKYGDSWMFYPVPKDQYLGNCQNHHWDKSSRLWTVQYVSYETGKHSQINLAMQPMVK